MGEALQLILLLITVVAGAIAIFFSFQLMKRYPLPFVNSYFYYLVFLYIFGVYGLIGSGVLAHLFTRMEVDDRTIQSARLIMVLLGIPFLALSKYMLLKTFKEYFQKNIAPSFTVTYFILGVAVLVLYGVFVIRFTRFNQGDFTWLITFQRWVFTGSLVFMYLLVWILTLLDSQKITGAYEKKFIRRFVAFYLLYMVLCCISFLFLSLHPILPFLFVFFLLAYHLIPILFLNLYLGKQHAPGSILQEDFDTRLEVFSGKYEISNREKEVIQLICRGMSNQEISESLFISLQTVKDHIHRIFVKTGVRNRVQLTNLIRST
ncbi:MAG TPA: LuxR family transcriptional regulator [Bacteroides sp.]|nr:LuxR family transcriptional regulator [Bacteroides sp.]